MAQLLQTAGHLASGLALKSRLALELPHINAALRRAQDRLPASVAPICTHILDAGGKRLRPFLTIVAANLLGYHKDDLYDLSVTLEMLHAATLLHDDVLDNAPTRRGKPAAHTCFPTAATILAGDALLALANATVASFANNALVTTFSHAIWATCDGEIAEINAQFSTETSLDDYLAIIRGKTATLLRAACEMGAILAEADKDLIAALGQFGEEIGIAFQLVDDALDVADPSQTGKPAGGDIREGKLTLPLRYFREQLCAEERARFDAAFTQGTFDEGESQAIAARIRDLNYDTQTRTFADTYLANALRALDRLPDRPERHLLSAMTSFVRDRKK